MKETQIARTEEKPKKRLTFKYDQQLPDISIPRSQIRLPDKAAAYWRQW